MSDSPILLVLLGPAEAQAVGTPVPISVRVRNISNHKVWMVGVLDGSEAGFRYPHYKPTITGPPDAPLVRSEDLEWCGMVAPLRVGDFRHLQPGEDFDPSQPQNGAAYLPLVLFRNFIPVAKGRYTVHLTLSTLSDDPDKWLGILEYPGKESVLERLSQVPRAIIESNLLTIEVN